MAHRSSTLRECRTLLPLAGLVLTLLAPARSDAGGPAPRLRAAVDDLRRASLDGTRPPRARAEADVGRLSGEARLDGVTVVLAASAAQDEELRALVAELHDPASPRYHRWLTPEAFAARFGLADEDLAAVAGWLEGHGLRVEEVSRGRDRLRCSGKVADLEAAFGTELHAYEAEGETRFAPAADVTVPAALAPLVRAVSGLSSFRPRPHLRPGPRFTSAQTGAHYLAPGDVSVVYGVGAGAGAGLDGTGVAIAVVGQSAVALTDLEAFQAAAGLPVKDPELVLVPGSGTEVRRSGDEAESDLDLEWAGALAPGAAIRFVHVGNGAGQSVWDAIGYAVDQDLAPIVSVSYGLCEPAIPAAEYASLEALLARAAAQGQSVVAASGDAGSVDCYGVSGLATGVQQALAVDYPSTSAYVTAVGGTEFPAAAVAPGATQYWAAAPSGDLATSALSYIPEQVWNDGGGAGGGGGVSVLTPRPSWQAGVPGLPAGTRRVVPDVSLDASPVNAPYVYCSSDSRTGVTGSCTHGFRDATSTYLTTAGGTSFGAPILAAMLARVEQQLNGARLGVVAPTLYRLAADGGTYAAAFHDVIHGGNQCGTACSGAGATSWAAAAGYDPASGLGSVDLGALLAAWPAPSPGFTVEAADASVAAGSSGTSRLTVVPVDGYAGTVQWAISSTPALGDGCLTVPSTTVSPGAAAQATVTIHAQSAACTASVAARGRLDPFAGGGGPPGAALAAAGILGLALLGRRRRRGLWAVVVLLAALGAGACGGGGSGGGGVARAARGTYVVQVVGTDSTSAALTSAATFTLTVR